MYDNPFNYVAALAAIVSLVLAFTPSFPRHRTYVRYAAVFSAGMLVGSVCASLAARPVFLQYQLGIPHIWLIGAAVVAAVLVILVIVWAALAG